MTTLTISIIVVFVLGYALIATESLTKVSNYPVDVGRLLDPLHGGSNAVSPVDAP